MASSFASMHSLAAKVSPATSIIAETFTSPDEVTSAMETEPHNQPLGLDEFTSNITPDDARVLVDLLKLAVATRAGEKGREVISEVLIALARANSQVCRLNSSEFC